MVHAFVLIDAEPARVAALAGELADLDGVAEVYSVAGHADIVAVVRVRLHEELADVVTRGISQLPGVTHTRTLIAFQAYSRRDLEAIWTWAPHRQRQDPLGARFWPALVCSAVRLLVARWGH